MRVEEGKPKLSTASDSARRFPRTAPIGSSMPKRPNRLRKSTRGSRL